MDLDLDLVRQPSEALVAFVPPMSIEDCPLLGLSTILRLGLKCGGLESKFGRGPRPRDRSGMGWSRLCLGYKRGVCFGVPSWDILIHESPFL